MTDYRIHIIGMSPEYSLEVLRLAKTLSLACGRIYSIQTISLEIAKACNPEPVFYMAELEKMISRFSKPKEKKIKQKRKGWESPYKYHK